jgi:hypothetical protein
MPFRAPQHSDPQSERPRIASRAESRQETRGAILPSSYFPRFAYPRLKTHARPTLFQQSLSKAIGLIPARNRPQITSRAESRQETRGAILPSSYFPRFAYPRIKTHARPILFQQSLCKAIGFIPARNRPQITSRAESRQETRGAILPSLYFACFTYPHIKIHARPMLFQQSLRYTLGVIPARNRLL